MEGSTPTDEAPQLAEATPASVAAVEGRGFVEIAGNPPPLNAEIVWYESRGRMNRLFFAAEPPKDSKGGGVKARGTVWVCPGRTEPIEKYFEVARDLQAKGFHVAIFDWPGQGLSQRLLKDPLKGHIRTYGAYVDAMRKGIEKLGRKAPHPHVVLAHSMGGAIALEAMRTRQVEVEAAAFSSPMWGIPIWFFQRWYARAVRFFGFGGMMARPPQPEETFATNQLTHDEARWKVYRDLIVAEPKLAVGEPTVGWVVATLNVLRELHESSALDHIRKMPMLVAQAAEDTIVKNAAQRRVARRLKESKLVVIEGSGHEILMEIDARRSKFWNAFDEMCKRAGI